MANVLFVNANSRPIDQSVSVQLYHTFLEKYKESHPQDTITELDLFQENLGYYDTDKINGMFGGVYSEGPAQSAEMAVNYVTNMLNFWGITDIEKVIVEGHNQYPQQAEEIIAAGLARTEQTAEAF